MRIILRVLPCEVHMSFNADFLRAEAIREVRASGCTLPGVAELIVEHHGASAVLADTSRIQALGEEVAASDTETGAKMRRLLLQMSKGTGVATTAANPPNVKDETKKIASETIPVAVDSTATAPTPENPSAPSESAASAVP